MIRPDGIQAAAAREVAFHPTTYDDKPITAWARRADTLVATIAEVNSLREDLDRLKEELASRPF